MKDYEEFDASLKNGKGSKKVLELAQQNNENYAKLKDSLLKQANENLNLDILNDYHLDSYFEFSNLDGSHFLKRMEQSCPLPYPNSMIKKFIKMEKTPINMPFITNSRGKNIFGVYMIGKENGKPILFSLSIIKGTEDNKDNIDFCIKVDMSISGKTWLPLLRLDSIGPEHPNYIIGNKLIQDLNDLKKIKTPHIHITNEQTQIILHDKLDYTSAEYLCFLDKSKSSNDKTFFKKSIDFVFEIANINAKINEKLKSDYNYNFNDCLLDLNNQKNVDFAFEIGESNEF